MNELFGLSMTTIMIVLVGLLAVCLGAFCGIVLSNRVMFRIGLRNVRRRRSQTTLIVSGLMLATVIITAAFTTGDVVDYSVTKVVYDTLKRTDLSIHHFREVEDLPEGYAGDDLAEALEARFRDDPDIEGFMPFLYEAVAVQNPRTRLSEPSVILAGLDPERTERFGGLRLVGGGAADLLGLAADEALIGRKAADKTDTRVGDEILVFTQFGVTPLIVVGIVEDERAGGTLEFGMLNVATLMETAQKATGRGGLITTVNVALRGGVRGSLGRTEAAGDRLDAFEDSGTEKEALGLGGSSFQVERVKEEALDGAKLAASGFTTIFLILGLFSIAAGAMLIFTLFVMLAVERRSEMGIARAVGVQRSHLVQSFVSEGMAYDLAAGLVGVVLGVAAAFVLVVGGARYLIGGDLSFISPHVTGRSLVVSFCLGTVLTFGTVVVSSVRVSQLNIVAAVRGQGEPEETSERRRRSIPWLVGGVLLLPALLPLGVFVVLRWGLGLPTRRITGPGGVALGVLFILLAYPTDLAFFLTGGISLVILGAGSIARSLGYPPRPVWTVTGGLLAVYWLSPGDPTTRIFGQLEGSMEMFVLSGIMIVTGFTLLIVFNARVLTSTFSGQQRGSARYAIPGGLTAGALACLAFGYLAGDAASGLGQLLFLLAGFLGIFGALSLIAMRMPRFSPALKMGVAYPLANRFRTGMTIAMFSIVVFAITVMGIINSSFLRVFATEAGRGGWDIVVNTNKSNPVADLVAALREEGSFDANQIEAVGRVTSFDNEEQQVRAVEGEWADYPIIAGDPALWQAAGMKLEARAKGYEDDRAVYDELQGDGRVAIVDSSILQTGFAVGVPQLGVDVEVRDGEFEPFQLELGDKVSGRTITVTVVGILSGQIPGNIFFGIYTNETTYRELLGDPEYYQSFVRLVPGRDAKADAKAIKAALVTKGVQAISLKESIDEAMQISRGFLRIFQAFMGLGLFVGIASLGVVALRSVVERRQQIGMLRAIGYQRGTVALSFMLESGFIALAGILSGVVGAAILSWNLLTSDYFPGASDIAFYMPWAEVIAYTSVAFVFALAMTWWPSRRAASVPVAEALRYE